MSRYSCFYFLRAQQGLGRDVRVSFKVPLSSRLHNAVERIRHSFSSVYRIYLWMQILFEKACDAHKSRICREPSRLRMFFNSFGTPSGWDRLSNLTLFPSPRRISRRNIFTWIQFMIFTISILACLLRKNFACLAWNCSEMILNPKGRMAQFQNSNIFHKSRQGCVSVC